MPRTTHGTLTLTFIGVGLTPSPCRHAYLRLLTTTPPLQEQHSQLQTIFPYLPLTELSLPCMMSSPPTLRSLPPSDDLATPTPAANSKNSEGSDTANTSRPTRRHYRTFPHTRLEFLRFSSDSDIQNFFFFIERGNFGWRGGWVEGSPSHRWSMEIESGGYSRPGYSQLGERGQVEPDK